MIIFKCKYENAWEISDMQIWCTNKSEKWDYEIVGNYENNIKIVQICLKTIFLNPDKRYKLIFEGVEVIPHNYDENTHGIIDVLNKDVVKLCNYEHDKIVSFHLYDEKPSCYQGLLKNIELYKKEFPDIKCYVYVQSYFISDDMINTIKNKGGIVISCVDVPELYKDILNMLPYENKNKLFLCRNTECRLIEREIILLKKFINQRYNFNIIRDNVQFKYLIPKGLWGTKNINNKLLRFIIMEHCLSYVIKTEKKEINENLSNFISDKIYEKHANDLYVLSVYDEQEHFKHLENTVERKNNIYIGELYDENGNPFNIKLRDELNRIYHLQSWKELGKEDKKEAIEKITINL